MIFPLDGFIKPEIDLSIEVVPEPEGPIIVNISPFLTENEILFNIVYLPT